MPRGLRPAGRVGLTDVGTLRGAWAASSPARGERQGQGRGRVGAAPGGRCLFCIQREKFKGTALIVCLYFLLRFIPRNQ